MLLLFLTSFHSIQPGALPNDGNAIDGWAQAFPLAQCISSEADDGIIVVCGRRDQRSPYRLPEISADYREKGLPRLEFGLVGNARGAVHTEAGSVAGVPSNKVKFTVTLPF